MEEIKITLNEYLDSLKSTSFERSFSRKYIPLEEKQEIINLALIIIFGKFEDGELIVSDVYQEPDTLVDDMYIKTSVIRAYTGIDEKNRVLIYDAFMQDGIYEKLLELLPDAYDFDNMIDRRISEKREYIKENRKNSMDEVLDGVSTLLSTLNSKASELDVKKLDKVIKKLNPQEIMKVYKNSGIGNDIRDKAIQDQAKEIKELKNQISARNVMADKTVGY